MVVDHIVKAARARRAAATAGSELGLARRIDGIKPEHIRVEL